MLRYILLVSSGMLIGVGLFAALLHLRTAIIRRVSRQAHIWYALRLVSTSVLVATVADAVIHSPVPLEPDWRTLTYIGGILLATVSGIGTLFTTDWQADEGRQLYGSGGHGGTGGAGGAGTGGGTGGVGGHGGRGGGPDGGLAGGEGGRGGVAGHPGEPGEPGESGESLEE